MPPGDLSQAEDKVTAATDEGVPASNSEAIQAPDSADSRQRDEAAVSAPSENTPAEQPKVVVPATTAVKSPANATGASSPLYVGGFGSAHPVLANVAFGDGTVRLLSSSIDPQVLRQLGHRADGKLLNTIGP